MFLLLLVFTYFSFSTQEPLNCPGITYVDRAEWKAKKVTAVTETQAIPIPNVFMHRTNTSCGDTNTCSNVMRTIQEYHMKVNNYHDIAFHFVIGVDEKVYEGRGWFLRGALEDNFNMKSISVAFIGIEEPTDGMKKVRDALIDCGKSQNYLSKDVRVIPPNQTDLFPTLIVEPENGGYDYDMNSFDPFGSTSTVAIPITQPAIIPIVTPATGFQPYPGYPTYPTFPTYPTYPNNNLPPGYPLNQWPYPFSTQPQIQVQWMQLPTGQIVPVINQLSQGAGPNRQQWQQEQSNGFSTSNRPGVIITIPRN